MESEVSNSLIGSPVQYRGDLDDTLSDYLKPQTDEAESYAVLGGAGAVLNMGNEPLAMAAGGGLGVIGGYIYSKARKHRQGRRAMANSWENIRTKLLE